MIPSVLYFCGYKKYLNIDNGNILTVYYLGGLKLYEKEEKTKLSPYMKNHIFDGDNHYLPILQKKGFAKQDFRNHHCYYELKMYFMACDFEQKEISAEKINEIIDKYLKTKKTEYGHDSRIFLINIVICAMLDMVCSFCQIS